MFSVISDYKATSDSNKMLPSVVRVPAMHCPVISSTVSPSTIPLGLMQINPSAFGDLIDDLETVGKEVGKILARHNLHSSPDGRDVTSSSEDLPALASAAVTQSNQQGSVMANDAGLSSRERRQQIQVLKFWIRVRHITCYVVLCCVVFLVVGIISVDNELSFGMLDISNRT